MTEEREMIYRFAGQFLILILGGILLVVFGGMFALNAHTSWGRVPVSYLFIIAMGASMLFPSIVALTTNDKVAFRCLVITMVSVLILGIGMFTVGGFGKYVTF